MRHNKSFLFNMTGVLVLTLAFLSGCKKNDNSSSAATPGVSPIWGSCSTCQGVIGQSIPGLVGVRSQTASGDAQFAFDVLVSQNGSVNWQDPKAFLYYSGPATLQGVIRIVQSGGMSFCGAPAGDYEVRPMNPSMISQGGIVSGGTFEALGPIQIVFRVGSSTIYNYQDPYGVSINSSTNRIGFNLSIDSVGGRYCGMLSTN